MARLSNSTRERMASALTDHRFSDRVAELTAESIALFKAVHEQHHDAETRKSMAAITKRNRDAFARTDDLTANVSGQRIRVGATSIGQRWAVKCEYRSILNDVRGFNGIPVDATSDLGQRLVAFAAANEQIKEAANLANREALGALNQFTTGKKLAEEWPEALPVIGDLIPEDDRTLPVIQVGRLNDTFKLPPHAKKAA